MSIIDNVFQPVYGKPCWQVKQGYGSFLTFEFGQPYLHIQEPRLASEQATEKVRKNAARRHVYVHGDWHLWVYLCDWRIISQGQEIANHNSNRRTIKKATIELDGQLLTQVSVSDSSLSIFEFDLGGRLEIVPNPDKYGNSADLWLLYELSGDVFTLRADGQYSRISKNVSPGKLVWRPLVVSSPSGKV